MTFLNMISFKITIGSELTDIIGGMQAQFTEPQYSPFDVSSLFAERLLRELTEIQPRATPPLQLI